MAVLFNKLYYKKDGLNKTQKIVFSAMLTALNFVYVWLMPTVPIPPWSFTPFSHIFIFIGVFISPYTGIMTCAATWGAFFFKGADPFVLLRAGSHIVFVIVLIFIINFKKINTYTQFIFCAVIIAVVHALAEVFSVIAGINLLGWDAGSRGTEYYIWAVVGLGTLGHSLLDMFAGYYAYVGLRKGIKGI